MSCSLRASTGLGLQDLTLGRGKICFIEKNYSSSPLRSRSGGRIKRSVWDRSGLQHPSLGSYILQTHTHTQIYILVIMLSRVSGRFQPNEGIYTEANDEKLGLVLKFEIQMFVK